MPSDSIAPVSVDRAKFVYRRRGNGRPLLLPNGFGGTSFGWDPFYRKFGDIVAAARARLSLTLINRQAAAMDAWHRNGAGAVLIATASEDVVIPPSNALKLVNAIPNAWLGQFPHGRHAFTAQHPHQLADLINCFLAIDAAKL